jgi:hypothetical protein
MQANDEITFARTYDPGRGHFCDTDRNGTPLPLPPVMRDPPRDRETNPKGTRHIDKTRQDHLPVAKRERVQRAAEQHQKRRNLGQG